MVFNKKSAKLWARFISVSLIAFSGLLYADPATWVIIGGDNDKTIKANTRKVIRALGFKQAESIKLLTDSVPRSEKEKQHAAINQFIAMIDLAKPVVLTRKGEIGKLTFNKNNDGSISAGFVLDNGQNTGTVETEKAIVLAGNDISTWDTNALVKSLGLSGDEIQKKTIKKEITVKTFFAAFAGFNEKLADFLGSGLDNRGGSEWENTVTIAIVPTSKKINYYDSGRYFYRKKRPGKFYKALGISITEKAEDTPGVIAGIWLCPQGQTTFTHTSQFVLMPGVTRKITKGGWAYTHVNLGGNSQAFNDYFNLKKPTESKFDIDKVFAPKERPEFFFYELMKALGLKYAALTGEVVTSIDQNLTGFIGENVDLSDHGDSIYITDSEQASGNVTILFLPEGVTEKMLDIPEGDKASVKAQLKNEERTLPGDDAIYEDPTHKYHAGNGKDFFHSKRYSDAFLTYSGE